jgi:hypothetical protein
LFMLGGSGCLHMYPFFFYGHIVVFSEQGRAGWGAWMGWQMP